jgi:hypothetical protein
MEQNIYAGEFAETETIVLGLSRYRRCEVALHMDDYGVNQDLCRAHAGEQAQRLSGRAG